MSTLWKQQAQRIFTEIGELSSDTEIGITRESYGAGENAAIDYLSQFARENGLQVHRDRAGNVIFQRADDDGHPAIWIGSHLDSVPQGGNYDGLAGVVAGLLCLCRLDQQAVRTRRPIRVLGLRGEESAWFGKSYMGSRALMGGLTSTDLALVNRFSKKTLGEAMQALGADLNSIRSQEWLIDPQQFVGYLEVHIEQAESLEKMGQAIGIVPGIRGNLRHNLVRCLGEDGHSGAVSREDRHDSVFAVSELVARIDRLWGEWLEDGRDLVVTVGTLGTNAAHHAVSRIPGEVIFSLEIRSLHQPTLEAFYALIQAEILQIEERRQVHFEFDKRIDTQPAAMHEPWVDAFVRMTREHGWKGVLTPSGAGHDAAVFANAGIPSAMLFIRNKNGSHNPYEAMELDDFIEATEVLYHTSQELTL
ncbi:hydantoinase/carbamoylase family amidase [Pseudomonas congelans]|uniref:Zn-dependent hydrolase n=1 Tax=Pseudomonas congelans TaxID=200452 RepID=UPI001F1836F7|nr:Zn-dependent hydrolase [Pseudomonas congelans]MCF5167434.1 hydantoinase/carbamoylase family amidase [Pseudomonas congelans]